MTVEEIIEAKISLLNTSPEALVDRVDIQQRKAWELLRERVRSLDIENGRIVKSKKNIRLISALFKELRGILTGGEYKNIVDEFIKSIDQGAKLSNRLGSQIQASFKPSLLMNEFLEFSKQRARLSLINEPAFSRIATNFTNILSAAISANQSLPLTLRQLKDTIIDKNNDVIVGSNIRTYATTTQAVADRQYSTLVKDAVGAKWFRYVGGKEMDTTREFCEERLGKYYHENEVKEWAGESWAGQIDGTNSTNIFDFAGGWNCRHTISMVSLASVPMDVIRRNIANGNFSPTEREKILLGL
jgi:hypothetical protein